MEREPTPEGAAVHRISHQRTRNGLTQQQFADPAADSDTDPGAVAGDLHREHGIVTVRRAKSHVVSGDTDWRLNVRV